MRHNCTYKIVVSLLSDTYSEHIIKHLKSIKELKITVEDNPNKLLQTMERVRPDLVIVSPIVISDISIPFIKERLGIQNTKFIAFCTTILEEKTIHNFDGEILLTDSRKELTETIKEVLDIESEKDEDILTPREKEVVIAVVKSLTNKEIADILSLSTHTIITHRRNIARKLNIHSPSGLTIYAIMNKLVNIDDIKI